MASFVEQLEQAIKASKEEEEMRQAIADSVNDEKERVETQYRELMEKFLDPKDREDIFKILIKMEVPPDGNCVLYTLAVLMYSLGKITADEFPNIFTEFGINIPNFKYILLSKLEIEAFWANNFGIREAQQKFFNEYEEIKKELIEDRPMYSDMLLDILIPLFGARLWNEYKRTGYIVGNVICLDYDPTSSLVGVLADLERAHRSPMVPRDIFSRYSYENMKVLSALDFSFERYYEREETKNQLTDELLEREIRQQEIRRREEEEATRAFLLSEGLI